MGISKFRNTCVTPAEAGIHSHNNYFWIPACAGKTEKIVAAEDSLIKIYLFSLSKSSLEIV